MEIQTLLPHLGTEKRDRAYGEEPSCSVCDMQIGLFFVDSSVDLLCVQGGRRRRNSQSANGVPTHLGSTTASYPNVHSIIPYSIITDAAAE